MQSNKNVQTFLWILRIVVGVLFILSGYSKLIDPHGLEYKMEEFYEKLTWLSFLKPYALASSIAMVAFEIIAGIALLIGFRFRLFAFLLLILMIIFTFLTGYAYLSGEIKECGCFGNCIKIEAHQSFYKDVILLVLILIIVALRKHITQFYNNKISLIIMGVFTFFSIYLQFWVLKHGPFIDCLPYKVGANIPALMKVPENCIQDSVDMLYIYGIPKGKDTVDRKEVRVDAIPDSPYVFVDRKDVIIRKGNCNAAIKDFSINNYDGIDVTQEILTNPGYVVLFISKNIEEANIGNIAKLKEFTDKCLAAGVPVYGASASDDIATNAFKAKHNIAFNFNSMDGTTCKTAMRANPGILVIKNGNIMYKGTWADYPSFGIIKK
jgi:uncharacterized membrane protein YphA (DoxX/SURF4 family)